MTAGVTLIRARRFADARGWFEASFERDRMAAIGVADDFVQDSQSLSHRAGTLRGLHFQRPPHAQAKLVRCLAGAVLDVVVDIRRASPSFGRCVSVRLDAETGDQLYVPVGFAHGFVTLTDQTMVAYKVSAPYAPHAEGGLAWDDPALGIDWPLDGRDPVLAPRDRDWPGLDGLDADFAYDGRPLALETAA